MKQKQTNRSWNEHKYSYRTKEHHLTILKVDNIKSGTRICRQKVSFMNVVTSVLWYHKPYTYKWIFELTCQLKSISNLSDVHR